MITLFTTYNPLHAQWVQTTQLYGVSFITCFTKSGSNLFAGTGAGVYLSTNNGTSWTAVNNGLTFPNVEALALIGTNLFAATVGGGGIGGLFLSTNNGTSWVNTGLTNKFVVALAVHGTNLFVADNESVFRTTSNGTSWAIANTGSTNSSTQALAVIDSNIFALTNFQGILLSTNNCVSWTKVKNDGMWELAVIDTNLFAADGQGVSLSKDRGASWTAVNTGLAYPVVQSFAVSGKNLFAGTGGGGVFLTTNKGTSWTAVNTGLPQYTSVKVLDVCGTDLFACADNGIYRRPLLEMVTGVEKISNNLPTHFSLEQNYPNPFNPSTTIKYSIPNSQFVTLKIFDMLGREVATLVNQMKAPGNYEVKFDGGKLSSDVYIYKMQADNYSEVKKMLLMK